MPPLFGTLRAAVVVGGVRGGIDADVVFRSGPWRSRADEVAAVEGPWVDDDGADCVRGFGALDVVNLLFLGAAPVAYV